MTKSIKIMGPNMKTIIRLMTAIALPIGLLLSADSFAAARLQKVDAVNQGNSNTQLRFFFDSAVNAPTSFKMASPNNNPTSKVLASEPYTFK